MFDVVVWQWHRLFVLLRSGSRRRRNDEAPLQRQRTERRRRPREQATKEPKHLRNASAAAADDDDVWRLWHCVFVRAAGVSWRRSRWRQSGRGRRGDARRGAGSGRRCRRRNRPRSMESAFKSTDEVKVDSMRSIVSRYRRRRRSLRRSSSVLWSRAGRGNSHLLARPQSGRHVRARTHPVNSAAFDSGHHPTATVNIDAPVGAAGLDSLEPPPLPVTPSPTPSPPPAPTTTAPPTVS